MFFGAVVTPNCPWKLPAAVCLRLNSAVYIKGNSFSAHTLAIRRTGQPDIAICRLHNPEQNSEQMKRHFEIDVRLGAKDLEAEPEVVAIPDGFTWGSDGRAQWHVSGYTLPKAVKQTKRSTVANKDLAAGRQER